MWPIRGTTLMVPGPEPTLTGNTPMLEPLAMDGSFRAREQRAQPLSSLESFVFSLLDSQGCCLACLWVTMATGGLHGPGLAILQATSVTVELGTALQAPQVPSRKARGRGGETEKREVERRREVTEREKEGKKGKERE